MEGLLQAGSIGGWSAAFCSVSGGTFLTVSFGAAPQNEPKRRKRGQPEICFQKIHTSPQTKCLPSVDECTLKFTIMNK